MQQQIEPLKISLEEYLQGELESEIRHEFFDGQIYAMAGAGEQHNLIAGNIFSHLRPLTRGTGCRLFIADMKLHIAKLNRFYYPDILLGCAPEDDNIYYKQSPCLIIEVLSPSTEDIDRREKLHAYQGISSLQEYILVAQDKPKVEVYRRAFNRWQFALHNSLQDSVSVHCLQTSIDMSTVYEDIF